MVANPPFGFYIPGSTLRSRASSLYSTRCLDLVSLVSKALGNAGSQLNSLRQAAAESAEPESEEVVHASLSVTAMSRVQQNLLFSSTYPQPIFNLLGVVMEHFESLLLAFGRVCDAF